MQSFREFQETVARYRRGSEKLIVPLHRRLGADMLTPVSAFYLMRNETDARYPFLLESVEGGEKLGRYSFLGRNPYRTLSERGGVTTVEEADGSVRTIEEPAIRVLERLMSEYREIELPDLPRLTCGAAGFLAYDIVRGIERLPDPPPSDLDLPDAFWCFHDSVAAFDHVRHQLVLISGVFLDEDSNLEQAYERGRAMLETMQATFYRPFDPRTPPVRLTGDVTSNMQRAEFESAVDAARSYIHEGDIFQVVLSQRFQAGFEGDPFHLYRALRQVNPSPYLYYLDFEDFQLVGSSPEVLVRVEKGRAELLPIAGTRPRGSTPAEDAALADELLSDPKERAEHIMLVDLGRNDLGRIARTGTVSVDRYAFIERYSHVMHIVSSVSAQVREECSALDVLAACFPAGTVSGAPKVRAMEIIDELEPVRRGPYAGAVGYIDFRGNLDTCITIRTMLVAGDAIMIQAGAGIVADSDPSREYDETVNKAGALLRAIRLASEDLI
ncbi:MAG: anthranilate synthase component I [Rhodothermales bacterium]|nr:anthranilate synthase component I [Rhodothermales bacterium]